MATPHTSYGSGVWTLGPDAPPAGAITRPRPVPHATADTGVTASVPLGTTPFAPPVWSSTGFTTMSPTAADSGLYQSPTLRVNSERFASRGFVSRSMSDTDSDATGAGSPFHGTRPSLGSLRSYGSVLGTTAQAVHDKYERAWWGAFKSPKYELMYSQWSWDTSVAARRGALAIAGFGVLAVVYRSVVIMNAAADEGKPTPSLAVASCVSAIVGFMLMSLGWKPRPFIMRYWNAISAVAFGLLLAPGTISWAAQLCDPGQPAAALDLSQCVVLGVGHVPWRVVIILSMAIIGTSLCLQTNWLYSTVMAAVLTMASCAVSLRFASASVVAEAYGYSALAVTVGALAARSRELAGRSFWASLHSVARAQSKQAAAERREQLVALKREAADARSEAVGAVMRYVCHELRNPLHGIIGLLDGIKSELRDADAWVGDEIGTVLKAAEGMTVILNDVLDLGQLQANSMQLSPQPTDSVELIDRSVLALHGVATVPIVCHIAASVPESIVVDPLRVGQIVSNAVSNAAKLTRTGIVELVAQVRDGRFWLEVFDTGPGISTDATNLFMAYSQDPHGTARATRSRFQRGTGLGLPISAQLVKLMGGDIGLENRKDGEPGARFWFWIPLQRKPGVSPAASPTPPSQPLLEAAAAVAGEHKGGPAGFAGDHVTLSIGSTSAGSIASLGSHAPGVQDGSGIQDGRILTRVVRVVPARARSMRTTTTATTNSSATSPQRSSGAQAGEATVPGGETLPRSILCSSPQYGSLQFRDHRSYGRGGGRSQQTLGSSSDARLPRRNRCGVCSGCRACRCCHRASSPNSVGSGSGVWRVDADGRPLNVDGAASPATRTSMAAADASVRGDDVATGNGQQGGTGGASAPEPASAASRIVSTGPDAMPQPPGTSAQPPSSASSAPRDVPVIPVFSAAAPGATGGAVVAGAATASATRNAAAAGAVMDTSPVRRRSERRKRSHRKPHAAALEFSGVHVLVVDDERINRTVLKRYCQKLGCSVRAFDDGDVLLEMLNDSSRRSADGSSLVDGKGRAWDMVFLDIMMQRSNGEDVCRQLRAAGITTPLVAATGNGVKADIDRYQEAGFNATMLKPFHADKVAAVLRRQLRGRGSNDAGSP